MWEFGPNINQHMISVCEKVVMPNEKPSTSNRLIHACPAETRVTGSLLKGRSAFNISLSSDVKNLLHILWNSFHEENVSRAFHVV